ncbi:hypothetical protein [Brachybacterium squillarum]|uniref:hypothetical protein n=1 Tax=Brachybacterium squillarum TaxID=661979 RepID=UPI002222EEA2|nr:hypothetical protein [Brachybacterium squillarum]MCW1805723.1 hypothetical protein [Brachybacterium squillarum]
MSPVEISRAVLLAAPSDGGDMTPSSITPGTPGFIAIFLVGIVILLLVVDMNRRVRRVQATAKVEARHAAEREAAEREASGTGAAAGGSSTADADGEPRDGGSEPGAADAPGTPEDPRGR